VRPVPTDSAVSCPCTLWLGNVSNRIAGHYRRFRCHATMTDRISRRLASARAVRAVAQGGAAFNDALDAVERMGRVSRERVLARFSAARVNDSMLLVVRECLK
jgi:hypothetical protein